MCYNCWTSNSFVLLDVLIVQKSNLFASTKDYVSLTAEYCMQLDFRCSSGSHVYSTDQCGFCVQLPSGSIFILQWVNDELFLHRSPEINTGS